MSSELPPYHPDQPEEDIPGYTTLPPLEPEDEPVKDEIIPVSDPLLHRALILTRPWSLLTFTSNLHCIPKLRIFQLKITLIISALSTVFLILGIDPPSTGSRLRNIRL